MKTPKFNIDSRFGRFTAQAYAWTVEHNGVNTVRLNLHKISENAYRSAQPTTYQLRRVIKEYGINTVVNLRGYARNSPLRALEESVCKEMGVKLVYVVVYSRKIPDANTIRNIKETLEGVEYPALFHCKSGADRAGLFSTLYRHYMHGDTIEEAMASQLKFYPYGHMKGSKTGLIDHFFKAYIEYKKSHDISLIDWCENVMDKESLENSFKPTLGWDILVDRVLRRE